MIKNKKIVCFAVLIHILSNIENELLFTERADVNMADISRHKFFVDNGSCQLMPVPCPVGIIHI